MLKLSFSKRLQLTNRAMYIAQESRNMKGKNGGMWVFIADARMDHKPILRWVYHRT